MEKNGKLMTILSITILFSLFTSEMTVSTYAQDEFGVDAREIELNTWLDGVISKPGGKDWYKFNVTAGDSLVIEVSNQSISMSAFFTLYSSEESILAWSYTKITHDFSENGTYYIEVKHSDSEYGVGRYSIHIRPTLPPFVQLFVFDVITSQFIQDAAVRIYTPLNYTLIGANKTNIDGVTEIALPSEGTYIITVSSESYNDEFGMASFLNEGANIRWAALEHTPYTGLILASAIVREVVIPNENNIIDISILNLNNSYPITLTGINILFPWFGFYDGELRGAISIVEDMPITIPANTTLRTSILFTPPSDATAYTGSFAASSIVDFFAQAPAWRTTVDVVKDVGIQENLNLTTVNIIPADHVSQGFRIPIVGMSVIPFTDPLANEKLDAVSVGIQDVSVGIQDISFDLRGVSSLLGEVSFRVNEVNVELASMSSRLKDITSILDDANLKLDDVSTKLSLSDSKLVGITSELLIANNRLNTVTSQLESANKIIADLVSQQQNTNSKLDTIDQRIVATQNSADDLLTDLFEDLRILLLAIIGVTAIIAGVNIIYLAKSFGPISKKAKTQV
tara:strand:+ start:295 stop:2001 length:1707 start_codon:yes stop_codon:yes gene_type:complete